MLDFETLGNGKDKCVCQVEALNITKTSKATIKFLERMQA